jgi:hypothetical protein
MEMQLILLQNGYLIPPTHWEAAALAEFPCLLRMAFVSKWSGPVSVRFSQ